MERFVDLVGIWKPQQQPTHLSRPELTDHGGAGRYGVDSLPRYGPLFTFWGNNTYFAALSVKSKGRHQWTPVGFDITAPEEGHLATANRQHKEKA